MTYLKIHLLGPPLVHQEERRINIQRRKAQALLYYLALSREPQPRERLAALLWPEHDQQAAHGALRRHLSELNAALGGGWLATGEESVVLTRPADLWVDVFAFQDHLARCRSHDHTTDRVCPACIEPLTESVALYRGDFLAGFTLPDAPPFDEWHFFQSEDLRQRCATALEQLVQAHVANDDVVAAIPYARRHLSLDPLHEAAHRQLMRLYVAGGQPSAALRQYDLCVQTLRTELDVAPAAETIALYEEIRQGARSSGAAQGHQGGSKEERTRHNLPASTTTFVGRRKEIATLLQLCGDERQRLITILGPGGIGKTRLALELASQLIDGAGQDLFFVRLAHLNDPTHMIQAIALAINLQFHADGRTPKEQLVDYLRQKHFFLVLDNFEHLLDGADLIQELLQSCPSLRLLVTSRERLQLTGETLFTLGNLDFPAWELPQEIDGYEAIQLFVEAAQRIRPHEPVREEEKLHIARICRLVGGMPLGIIMAAAWVEVLSPAEIAADLTRGFDLLETELRDLPERQRSMRTVITYSWQRLSPAEQAIFIRLSYFQGGFTRLAAEKIAGASLSMLARLVDKSFIQRSGEMRYDVHELLRQFAAQQLKLSGYLSAVQEAHGTYYLNCLHGYKSKMAGPQQLEALLQLEADFENIRTAWLWAVQAHQYTLIDHALDALFHWFFWLQRSRQQEGLALLESARQAWTSSSSARAHRVWGRIQARLLEQRGPWLDHCIETRQRIEDALLLARQHGDPEELSFCTWGLGLTYISEEALLEGHNTELWRAIDSFEAALTAYRGRGDLFWIAQTLEKMGHAYRRMNICDRAVPPLEESLTLRRKLGDHFGEARSLRELAFARFHQGMEHEALEGAEAAYELQCELGDQQGIADSRFFLALYLLIAGDLQRARALFNAVEQYAIEMNVSIYRKWIAVTKMLVQSMEENIHLRRLAAPSFPNRITPFSSGLTYLLFATDTKGLTEAYNRRLQQLFALATTDSELALGLFLASYSLAHVGEQKRAVTLISLAFRYPEVAGSWLVHHAWFVELQEKLRKELPPEEFAGAWAQGQLLDLQQVCAEVLQELTALCHRLVASG
jgi:predicted ATPase/DNA-binding SARP family transcriptional activator